MFLQGGGTLQFSMVPLNLLRSSKKRTISSQASGQKAATEAQKFGDIRIAATSEPDVYTYIPKLERKDFARTPIMYITTNNTIYGSRYSYIPDTGGHRPRCGSVLQLPVGSI